ncbi:hypothetical protein RND71_000803 [Anisodus tanguticus]|uniref:Uncharacterized protein n=1 Tax=Anisodus tanguticus TaxID=243964 RepID=A0AAE1VVF1_9SOLA|nr:hypothetical protein RND71_000803 [Anisodus tanguticus]
MGCIQLLLGSLVILVSLSSLFRFYSAGFFLHDEDICRHFYGVKDVYNSFDIGALSSRVDELLDKMDSLQEKIELVVQEMEKNKDDLEKGSIPKLEYKRFLEDEVIKPLYSAHIALRQIRLPRIEGNGNDWNFAQKLMINGCDPLPRRRCLTRASKLYQKPYPINESLWRIPDGRNVRWSNYLCRNYECLSSRNPKRGYTKCTGCFEMEKEELKWVTNSSLAVDFFYQRCITIREMRIGLDYGIGTGTFSARMREQNVTIISTALNLGAPFSETIALRGLIPLYVTLNQRLPFFDNTAGFMDGLDESAAFRYKKHKWSVAPKAKDEVYLSALLEKPPRSL